jgi:hypothetical protein
VVRFLAVAISRFDYGGQSNDRRLTAVTVLLKDILEALEMQFDGSSSFLDLDTGRVETVSSDLLRQANESPDEEHYIPGWQEQEWELVKRIVSTNRFRQLPTKFDVHEWAIMQDFSRSVASDTIREDLLNAIHGAGAFRHFKEAIRRHRVESVWFSFRTDALTQVARQWCEEHQIGWQ